jgi:hypothetical protein
MVKTTTREGRIGFTSGG